MLWCVCVQSYHKFTPQCKTRVPASGVIVSDVVAGGLLVSDRDSPRGMSI